MESNSSNQVQTIRIQRIFQVLFSITNPNGEKMFNFDPKRGITVSTFSPFMTEALDNPTSIAFLSAADLCEMLATFSDFTQHSTENDISQENNHQSPLENEESNDMGQSDKDASRDSTDPAETQPKNTRGIITGVKISAAKSPAHGKSRSHRFLPIKSFTQVTDGLTFNTSSSPQKPLIVIDAPNVAMRYGINREFKVDGIVIAIDYWENK